MSNEHEFAGGAMDKINELTGGYTVPHDGCNSYQVAFKMLELGFKVQEFKSSKVQSNA